MSRTSFKFFIVPRLLKWLLSLVVMTCRFKYHDKQTYESLLASAKPFVIVLWHDCSTIAGWAMKNQPVTVMVSNSRDGEYVARLSELLRIPTLRGSTSKGAGRAILSAMKVLRQNKPVAITPDGPRGPRYQLQHGCLWLAASCQSPIIHFHIEATRQWQLRGWDKHRFPKPFSTIHVRFTPQITVQRTELETNIEQVVDQVQTKMLANVRATRTLAGYKAQEK